jgi:putative ABC transport system permease protein
MIAFLQDLRYAARTLRRNAALSVVIVGSLAIGIGANTAIFSVVNALLLEPLPYPEPDRLAVLWLRSPGINIPQDWPSPGQFIDVRTENRSFEEMSISQGRAGTLLGREEAQRVEGLLTSSSLFRLLGARPLYGRLLRPDEDAPGKPPVVILSYGFWKRAFNADPGAVGGVITLNGFGQGGGDAKNQFEIAGVLRPDFQLNDEIMPTVASIRQMDVFLPLPLGADAVKRRGDENYNLMARLKPGVTMAQARADVAAIAARIRDQDRRDRTFTIDVVPLVESVVGNVRVALLVVLGSVALVLLIACANVANLLLTRATSRQKEIAVRTALGASWKRLVRQLLTESVLLALLGGAAGLAIARIALQVVRGINPGNIPRLEAIALDGRVLAFTFAVSIGTGILFGLAPALRAARVDLNASLKAGGRNAQGDGGFGSRRRRLRSLLVVGEVAISLMLLIAAGLLVRSFVRLQQVSPGFEPDGVISMRVGGSARQFANRDASLEFYRAAGEALASVPGRRIARGGNGAAVHVLGRMGQHQRRGMDAAAGTGAAGRSARRHARLLQDDEDSARAGAVLHRRRFSADGAAGRDRGRKIRAAVLAGGRRDRQAGVERSRTQAHHRRRGRHGETVRPRRRRPDRRLSARPLGRLPGRAHGLTGPCRGCTGHDPQDP